MEFYRSPAIKKLFRCRAKRQRKNKYRKKKKAATGRQMKEKSKHYEDLNETQVNFRLDAILRANILSIFR